MCEPFTARASFLSHAYLALLNDVGAKQLGFDAESPGRFEVLAAILSPHLVVILPLLSRHNRAALLTRKVGRWGGSKQNVSRACETAMSLGRGAGRVAGRRAARRDQRRRDSERRTVGGRGGAGGGEEGAGAGEGVGIKGSVRGGEAGRDGERPRTGLVVSCGPGAPEETDGS